MSKAKWEKTPYMLTWTVHSVDLKTSVDGEFKLDWSRGSSKGSTDMLTPSASNTITFESQFEIPCTMFVSKSDGMARQKNLKIVLKRHKKKDSKVYGKLTIDIAKFYGKPGIVKEDVEMESGRAIAPVISMSFALRKEGDMMEVAGVDGTDLSFMGEPQDRMATAIDEWDVTEVAESVHSRRSKKKKKHGKHGHHEAKHEQAKQENEVKHEPEVKHEQEVKKEEEVKHEPEVKKEEEVHAKEEEELKAEEEPAEHEEQEKQEAVKEEPGAEEKPEDAQEEQVNEEPEHAKEEEVKVEQQAPTEEPAAEKVEPVVEKEEPKVEHAPEVPAEQKKQPAHETKMSWDPSDFEEDQLTKELVEQLLDDIAEHKWSCETGFIDAEKKYKYPAVVFPIFATMIQTSLFSDTIYTKDDFEELADKICTLLTDSSICKGYSLFQKFLTYLMLYLLVLKSEQYDNDRSESMCEHLLELIKSTTTDLIRPSILSFEVLVNRFATAKFEMEPLLEDFKHIYHDVRNSLRYLPSINRFLLNRILNVVEVRIMNRMLANPSRFMFKNAVLWNSIISAFLSDERLEMTLLREMVSAMIMAHSMAGEPDMKNDIAADIDPRVILFIMTHYNPDEMMPEKIDTTKFANAHSLSPDITSLDELPEPEIQSVGKLGEEAILANWNKYAVTEDLLLDFPFLDEFASLD